MKFSAFARFNGGFRFSGRQPHGRRIYEALKASQGDTYEESFHGRQSARLYAAAMSLAAAQYQSDRALANATPRTANEMLPQLERDYQIVPGYRETPDDRRAIAQARYEVTRGSRRESVEGALRALLGSAFIGYDTTEESEIVTWPNGPEAVGTFERAGTVKRGFRITAPIATVQTPVTVAVSLIPGLELPRAGEAVTVEPDSRNPSAERVVIAGITSTTVTTTFQKPHAPGAIAIAPHPVWISSQRYSRIIVTFAAATNQETRRKINEVMARMARGVSQWCVVSNEGTFRLGHATRARLGCTRLV